MNRVKEYRKNTWLSIALGFAGMGMVVVQASDDSSPSTPPTPLFLKQDTVELYTEQLAVSDAPMKFIKGLITGSSFHKRLQDDIIDANNTIARPKHSLLDKFLVKNNRKKLFPCVVSVLDEKNKLAPKSCNALQLTDEDWDAIGKGKAAYFEDIPYKHKKLWLYGFLVLNYKEDVNNDIIKLYKNNIAEMRKDFHENGNDLMNMATGHA